jgi:hypothetical protein
MNQAVLNRSRHDKFDFILDLPKALKKEQDIIMQNAYNADQIQFTTIGSPVPTISVPPIKVPYAGQNYHASSISRPAYDPLQVKFLLDNGYQNYWVLWKWLNLFNDSADSITSLTTPVDNNNRLTNPMTDFTANFNLYGLDEFNKRIISFEYKNAFITQLSPINFSFQETNEINCTATFVFNQLHVNLLKDVNVSSC